MTDLSKTIPDSDTLVVELIYKGEVIHNDDGTPMWIEVYLPHSKEYRKAKHEQADTLMAKKTERLKSEEAEELGMDFLVKTTKAWDITYKGEKPKFSPKRAKDLYSELIWIPEFIYEKVEEHKAFTKA